MTLKIHQLALPLFALCLVHITPVTSQAVESNSAKVTCGQLVSNKCLDCHSETRICYRVKKGKTTRYWKKSVQYMIRNGASINEAESKDLVTCLSEPDKEIFALCGIKK